MSRYKVLMMWTVSPYHRTPAHVQAAPVLTETLVVEATDPEKAAEVALQQETLNLDQDVLGLREDVALALAVQQVTRLETAA